MWDIFLIINVSPGSLSVSFDNNPSEVLDTLLEEPSVTVLVSAVATGLSFGFVIEIVNVVVSVSAPSVIV